MSPPAALFTPSNTTISPPTLSPSLIKSTEMNWVIGMSIGFIAYGVLLTLGLTSFGILHRLPRPRGFWNQRSVLMIYIAVLMALNTVLQANTMRGNLIAIFETPPEDLTYFYLDRLNILAVCVLALTDGLLNDDQVWRCYMVQKILLARKPTRWHHICWILPMILWLIFIGVGTAAVVTSNPDVPFSEPADPRGVFLLIVSLLCNILLNLFATTNIVVRLLIHRRSMITSFGHRTSLSNVHLRIIAILLESSAINLPIAIVSAICAGLVGGLGLLAVQIGVPSQSFSSVLVIYQIARGRAVGSQPVLSHKENSESQYLETVVFTQPGMHEN